VHFVLQTVVQQGGGGPTDQKIQAESVSHDEADHPALSVVFAIMSLGFCPKPERWGCGDHCPFYPTNLIPSGGDNGDPISINHIVAISRGKGRMEEKGWSNYFDAARRLIAVYYHTAYLPIISCLNPS